MHDDVIAAIATGYTTSAIGIIRVSGNSAFSMLPTIFTSKPPYEHRKIYYGHIKDLSGNVIDEVLISIFKSPHSYTGEDSFEISCHGGLTVLSSILEVVLDAGARMAQPGEFTKRAFLNGKIDLSQAEAVEKIISSKSKRALAIAERQLQGKFSSKLDNIREQILILLAENEVAIDHPDEELSSMQKQEKIEILKDTLYKLEQILHSSECGDALFEGVVLALVGKPNVGKSSLLNILTGTERSIVTDIPGTTRDVVSESFNIDGIPFTILDTAGIRHTKDTVENLGAERSRKAIKNADIVLIIFDGSKELDKEDYDIINYAKELNKKIVGVVNKTDVAIIKNNIPLEYTVNVSCKMNTGIDRLKKTVSQLAIGNVGDNDIVSLNASQKNSLKEGIKICKQLIKDMEQDIDPALIGVDFLSLVDSLDEILGRITNEDMLDVMFRRFCIGK